MKVYLVGIGMGNTLTGEAKKAIQSAQCIIGAKRMLDAVQSNAEKIEAVLAKDIAEAILQKQYETVAVVFSGDVGFYSGAKQLRELLSDVELHCICGISTVQYLCAKLARSWQDMKLVSLHGRKADVVALVLRNKECFFLTDATCTPAYICKQLVKSGLSQLQVSVGECLSYPEEQLTQGTAETLAKQEFHALSAVIVDNPDAEEENRVHGLDDSVFIRGKTPMTKQEVRSVALSKLQLKSTDIVYDVGGGTGSVSVEMARQCARVYAVECKEDALALMAENREKFKVYNMEIISGMAPQALLDLPPPDAAFIGGTRGNMAEILACLVQKNQKLRVVITAIALETLGEAIRELSRYCTPSVLQLAANRGKNVGNYNMMTAENPIWILYGDLSQ